MRELFYIRLRLKARSPAAIFGIFRSLPMRICYLKFAKGNCVAGSKLFKKFKEKMKELKYNLAALYLVYKRNDTPILAKIVILITIGYALSPIDLIPDFIPVLGYLDDLVLLPFLIYLSLKLVPKEIMQECRERVKDLWKDGKPKKWYYAVPIILIYLLVLFLIARSVLSGIRKNSR